MLRCPLCNSEDYHIIHGYGSSCDDCGYGVDGEGNSFGGGLNEEGDDE